MSKTFAPIKASIDPSFLSRVDRVFDASPRTVFNELLQNSRRAGATRVKVDMKCHGETPGTTSITFSDNGAGMDKPDILLRLAGNEWERATMENEDPAGMGFFCLSNFPSVTARSHYWELTLTPEAFRGEVELQPTFKEGRKLGTKLSWEWEGKQPAGLRSCLCDAARHCGIEEVIVNYGSGSDERLEVKDFLHDAEHIIDLPELGYRLGISPRYGRWPYHSASMNLNFKGVQLTEQFDDSLGCLRDLHRLERDVKVDVSRTTDLHLVLPARNALKHNEARDRLMAECEKALLLWVAATKKGAHRLSFSTYTRAKELGIDIGEAVRMLSSYSDEYRGATGDAEEEKKFMDAALLIPPMWQEKLMKHTWDDMPKNSDGRKHNLVRPKVRYEGYSWYNVLPSLVDPRFIVNGVPIPAELFMSEELPIPDDLSDEDKQKLQLESSGDLYKICDSLAFAADTSDESATYHYDLEATVSGEGTSGYFDSAMGDRIVYVSKPAMEEDEGGISGTVADIIEELCFEASDDSEADNWETQQQDFQDECITSVLAALGGVEVAMRHVIRTAIERLRYETKGWEWTVESKDGEAKITSLTKIEKGGDND